MNAKNALFVSLLLVCCSCFADFATPLVFVFVGALVELGVWWTDNTPQPTYLACLVCWAVWFLQDRFVPVAFDDDLHVLSLAMMMVTVFRMSKFHANLDKRTRRALIGGLLLAYAFPTDHDRVLLDKILRTTIFALSYFSTMRWPDDDKTALDRVLRAAWALWSSWWSITIVLTISVFLFAERLEAEAKKKNLPPLVPKRPTTKTHPPQRRRRDFRASALRDKSVNVPINLARSQTKFVDLELGNVSETDVAED